MVERRALPSQERLLSIFEYDAQAGALCRRQPASGPKAQPSIKQPRMVRVDGVQYLAHRLIWKMQHGTDPDQVDHRSRDRTDNNVKNLRSATRNQNRANSVKNRGRSLPKGVYAKPNNCYEAAIVHNKKRIYLGLFRTPQAAHSAYACAAAQYHGEFARTE